MKKLLLLALLCFTIGASAQDTVSFQTSSGLYEDSVDRYGIGWYVGAGFAYHAYSNLGFVFQYDKIMRDYDLQQAKLEAFFEYEVDYDLSLRPRVGMTSQFSDKVHFSFGVDIMARASKRVQVFLPWSVTVRGAYGDVKHGWSHTVGLGVNFKV